MTSRERAVAALAHRRTDRAPANFHAHKEVADRLVERLGLSDEEELRRALGVDLRRVRFDYSQPDSGSDADGYVRTMWGARRRVAEAGEGRPALLPPFDEDTRVDDVHAHPWPDPAALDYSGIAPQCESYADDYLTYGAPWSPFFHEVGWLIGQETMFVWMWTRPDVLKAIIGHVVNYEVEATRRFLEAAGGRIDLAYFGNDFGTQRGLVLSPAMWLEFFRDPLKRFFDVAHDYGCRVMKHSCGAVRELIPFWIEDGVDILDPIQVRAEGMALPGLVRDYGGRLCFHGAVDTQCTLPFGGVADVRAEVRSYLDLTRRGGGYILCGSQDYIADIPLDNILAIYDENLKRP